MIGWILLLYFGGLFLIVAEFFVPGGICGAFGGAAVLASAAMAVMYFPSYAFFVILAQFIGVVIAVIAGIKLFPYTPLAKVMILHADQDPGAGYVNETGNLELMGAEGEAFSALRPAGSILVNGVRHDAVSDGSLIDKGARVKVIEVRGNRIVVE
jgi:membrane-bound serine protease (ClpP class)